MTIELRDRRELMTTELREANYADHREANDVSRQANQ